MHELIDRYLDGELTPPEAEALLRRLREDPELESELREYEEMLAQAARSGQGQSEQAGLSPQFTQRVMAEIHATVRQVGASHPSRQPRDLQRSRSGPRRWQPALALAASVLLVFGLGYLTARIGPQVMTGPPSGAADPRAAAGKLTSAMPVEASPATQQLGLEGMRMVRLVYLPQKAGVKQVSVAGTFNGWDPSTTPMQREGNVWTALLILPPDTHEYMFVENGQDWITDPLALQTRDDGFGRMNAVLDLSL
jgi:anti-sigma factor RsiW